MMTLRLFAGKFESVPASTSWYLSDLGEARGKQELFTRQSPQRLRALREHALIESAVSSNRIEGVEVDKSRIATIVFGKPLLRDRDEEVGRYISLERLIEQNKERYYETLEESSYGWHEGKHDPWPYINYTLFIIKTAYREFEQRLGQLQSPKGEKTILLHQTIGRTSGPFSVAELQNACPNVSVDMIRRVLKNLRSENRVECLGRGQNAKWRKTGKWQLGNTQ